ncbi:MAG: NAD(P)H-hydrate dehydratase [Oceanicaulis sp.]|uniref:NAD(P)H-hydrate dehydratase n=1 Tax=Glycocaulis sp. TaxID=1969725 RepID=UPI0025C0D146|nr:NAD(P)H-hydrate dehydratase [Glycocaulis sp.]MCC5982206.1 NAD(P)H-hydrate dehydratase [Oceanicaulis sp.]MCH8521144.1 NAD(P)H-hydrate dehydratase [Glycocaulis sp.]
MRAIAFGALSGELLTTAQIRAADAHAIKAGVAGISLMERAGAAVASAIMSRWAARAAAILCGPGNNGGDGYVVARRLSEAGWPVEVFVLGDPAALKGDAAHMAGLWEGTVRPLDSFKAERFGLVVDALFGSGLSRPLDGMARKAARSLCESDCVVVAVDVPSGVNGDESGSEGPCVKADLTVTFHRLKPAHLFHPARASCGEIVLADIDIPDGWREGAGALPEIVQLPRLTLPETGHDGAAHKHGKGRLCVLAGPPGATGAARLSATAGLKAGAGLVTLLCPPASLMEAASASLAVMTKSVREEDFRDTLAANRASALVMGPGAGLNETLKARVLAALSTGMPIVLDADALSVFADDPNVLFAALHDRAVLTPHTGEFERLFPGLLDASASPVDAARAAAAQSGAIVLLKGPATVIAHPDGRVAVNIHASARLATAGSGDVLAGLIGALLAQGIVPFEAAQSAAFFHGEAGYHLPPGGTAEDLLDILPGVLSRLSAEQDRLAALARLKPPA